MISVGRYGSPGRVRRSELLHSIIIGPGDLSLSGEQLNVTFASHVHRKGMSVLRGGATTAEFERIVSERLGGAGNKWVHGVASFACDDVRRLVATANSDQRRAGDRLFCVLDTDLPELPHHADVFATKKAAGVWRAECERVLNLLMGGLTEPALFRNGLLSTYQKAPQ
jgi:hypothetical protein